MVRHLYHATKVIKHGMLTYLYTLSSQVQIMGGDCWWENVLSMAWCLLEDPCSQPDSFDLSVALEESLFTL